jgi:hypothetical protein
MRRAQEAAIPTARTEDLLIEHVDDETVVYDLVDKQVHCLGPLAAAVFAQCDGATPPADIALAARERIGRPVSTDDVAAALAQLEERGLLSRPVLQVHNGMSRREVMRKSARVGAVAAIAPLITSIAAPSAAMAQSGIPSGCTGCGQNKDCVSNHCCQNVAGKQCNQSCCVADDNSCHLVDPNCTTTTCACTAPLAGCGSLVCPPESSKCCT